MRIINIIESNTDSGIIGIESFGIFEEQLSEDVVEKAEDNFIAKAVENGADEENIDDYIDQGYYSRKDGYTVSIVWSDI